MSAKFADTIKFLKGNYRSSAQNPAPAITAGFAAYKQFVHEICPTMVRLPRVITRDPEAEIDFFRFFFNTKIMRFNCFSIVCLDSTAFAFSRPGL